MRLITHRTYCGTDFYLGHNSVAIFHCRVHGEETYPVGHGYDTPTMSAHYAARIARILVAAAIDDCQEARSAMNLVTALYLQRFGEFPVRHIAIGIHQAVLDAVAEIVEPRIAFRMLASIPIPLHVAAPAGKRPYVEDPPESVAGEMDPRKYVVLPRDVTNPEIYSLPAKGVGFWKKCARHGVWECLDRLHVVTHRFTELCDNLVRYTAIAHSSSCSELEVRAPANTSLGPVSRPVMMVWLRKLGAALQRAAALPEEIAQMLLAG